MTPQLWAIVPLLLIIVGQLGVIALLLDRLGCHRRHEHLIDRLHCRRPR
jgi:uncharacterized membrane protein YdcZ (DUF606 family)